MQSRAGQKKQTESQTRKRSYDTPEESNRTSAASAGDSRKQHQYQTRSASNQSANKLSARSESGGGARQTQASLDKLDQRYNTVTDKPRQEQTPEINSSTTVEFESSLWISDSSRKEVQYTGSRQSNQKMEVEDDISSGASPGMSYEEGRRTPRCVSMIVIGAGARGKTYSRYAIENPHLLKVTGVAEPRQFHRELMRRRHNLPEDRLFDDWKKLAHEPKLADAVCITTQDNMHVDPAVMFAEKGYHILLEKPMAGSAADCRRIVEAVKRNNVVLAIGHVLRYTPYVQKIKEIIKSGAIGEVINIQHLEPIGNWHFAHSYVRGPWSKEADSTFMLMAKCCHDVDLIRYIIDKACIRVSSFGDLTHFRRDKRPDGAAERCLDCAIEENCPYSAKKIYLDRAKYGDYGWPVSIILDDEPSVEAVEDALRNGPYGRCVWSCDNDVADHQVVNMQFQGGVTATLTTAAFTEHICQRRTRIFGSLGELDGDGDSMIRHFDFTTRRAVIHETEGAPPYTSLVGHNGADFFLIEAFTRAISTGDRQFVLSGPDESLESHLIVFAAEAARRAGSVVSVKDAIDGRLDGLFPPAPSIMPVLLTTSTPSSTSGAFTTTYTAGVSVPMNLSQQWSDHVNTAGVESAGGDSTQITREKEDSNVAPSTMQYDFNANRHTFFQYQGAPPSSREGDMRHSSAYMSAPIATASDRNESSNGNAQGYSNFSHVMTAVSSSYANTNADEESGSVSMGVVPVTGTVADATLDAVIGATTAGRQYRPVENVEMTVTSLPQGSTTSHIATSGFPTDTPVDFNRAVPGTAPSASDVAALVSTGLNVAHSYDQNDEEAAIGMDGGASPLHVTDAAEATGAVGLTQSFDEVMDKESGYELPEEVSKTWDRSNFGDADDTSMDGNDNR
eukprot:gb/GECG01011663.1/.p1 GENE.gb/GECG01011663.1/~~gb/GECG01011663.1/.p1  ORF type:complete len:903 (+),score=99.73 gb/GECG01011663.1/:1-2709(+)